MPTVDESGLRKRIGAGELSGLFVVAGEEKYLVKRLAQQLIKRAAGDAFPEFNNQAFTNDSSLDSVGAGPGEHHPGVLVPHLGL